MISRKIVDPNHLQDGFQEIFSFRGHKIQVKGVISYELQDDYFVSEANRKQLFLSWDARHIIIWEKRLARSPPKLLKKLEFQNKPANYIGAVLYVPKLKVFIAAALDMSFLIYDKNLNLLESIHHGERAILRMEYIADKALILLCGASGLSIWRIYRGNTLSSSLVMEKMKSLSECVGWISHMIYDKATSKLYAIAETTGIHYLILFQSLLIECSDLIFSYFND